MKEKTINDIIQKEKVFQGKIWNRYLKDFQELFSLDQLELN